MKTITRAAVSAVALCPLWTAAAESLGVVAVAPHPGPTPELVELTRQLRLAVAERTEGVLDASQLSQRMTGPATRTSLTELDRAYAGALAMYQAGDPDGAVRTLREVVDELELALDSPEAFGQWTRAMMRLARSLQTIGRNDEAKTVLERLMRSAPGVTVDLTQYPPSFEKQVSETRARLRALPARDLTVRTTATGAKVFVDGREVGTAPLHVSLAPGRYRVSGSAGSLRLPGTSVDLTEESQTFTLDFAALHAFRPSLGPGLALPLDRHAELVAAGAYLGVDRLVVAGLLTQGGVDYLVGTHLDVRKGTSLREGRVRLSKQAAPAGGLAALANFLVNGEQSPLVLSRDAAPAPGREVVFKDPVGDDDGPGIRDTPKHHAFAPGSFDLTELKVTQVGERVTFAVSLRSDIENPWGMPSGFSVQLILIHIKNGRGGFTRGLPVTNVLFAPEHAWNKVVILSPHPAPIVEARVSRNLANARASIVLPRRIQATGRTITATVDKRDLGRGDVATWSYQVLVRSNERSPEPSTPVAGAEKGVPGDRRRRGGGDGDCRPHVIDMLAGRGEGTEDEIREQHDMLSYECRDGAARRMATLKMVRR